MSLFQTQIERQYIAGITTDLVPIYKKYVDSDDDDVVEHMESLGERPVYKGRKWEELIDHDI